MNEFFEKNRKACIIGGTLIFAAVFAFYLFALFRPGYWHREVFLYKEKAPFEGMSVFSGHDAVNKADYELTMAKEGTTTYMAFTVNETERSYEINSDDSEGSFPAVEIFENGELVFRGTYMGFLMDENDEPFEPLISIGYGPYVPTEEELFPSYNWLYDVSRQRTGIRGNIIFFPVIIIIAAVVIIDMIHPDLLWELNHRLSVEGGKPSEFYRSAQKISWILAPVIIIIFMIMSFMTDIMLS